MTNIPLQKETISYLFVLGIITVIIYFLLPAWAIDSFVLLLFIIYFFWDPNRTNINTKAEAAAEDFLRRHSFIRNSIFLSFFNIHANTSSFSDEVVKSGIIVIGVVNNV